MSLQPLSKAFFGVPADDESFNLPAAAEWYGRIMKMDLDSAQALVATLVFESSVHDQVVHHTEIAKCVNAFADSRREAIKTGLMRSYVSKRMSGDDIEATVRAVEAVAKAQFDFDWDPNMHPRDASGRFRTKTKVIPKTDVKKPLNDFQARVAIGLEPKNLKGDKYKSLDGRKKARFQQDYGEVARFLSPYTGRGMSEANTVVNFVYDDGTQEMRMGASGAAEQLDAAKYNDGKRLSHVQVAVTDANAQGLAVNLMPALAQDKAAQTVSGVQGFGEGFPTFAQSWTNWEPDDARQNTKQAFRRLEASAELADSVLAEDSKYRLATKVGRWVGQHGSEVDQVVGPTARKSTYRYRGVERKPEAGIQGSILSAGRRHTKNGVIDTNAAREEIINGVTTETARGGRIERDHKESPVVGYFANRLPKQRLTNLQLASGRTPPSEGVIIDRGGNVITQAVGYGDDHYLPFNLKNNKRISGGEYIRTRSYGGPTTEDIYAGLVFNARAMTVVSHSGVYTVEFDDTFRGSRRYNDKAAQMVKRYGELLDAVQSRKVTPAPVPHDRRVEIEQAAAAKFDPQIQPKAYATEVKALLDAEKERPVPSAKQNAAWENEFLASRAERIKTPDGTMLDVEGMKNQWVNRQLVNDTTANLPGIPDETRRDILARKRTNLKAEVDNTPVETMGLGGEDFDRFMRTKQTQYLGEQSPLRLDGSGYKAALDALNEQFPYYISSIKYRPLRDEDRGIGSNRTDPGYIKPRFNRPAQAQAGYFDESIYGQGKMGADTTNYQNVGVARSDKQTATEEDQDETPVVPGAPAKKKPEGEGAAMSVAFKEQRKAEAAHAVWADVMGKQAAFNGRTPAQVGQQVKADTANALGVPDWLRNPDLNREQFVDAYMKGNGERDLDDFLVKLTKQADSGQSVVDESKRRAWKAGGQTAKSEFNATKMLSGTQGLDDDFTDWGDEYVNGRTVAQYAATAAGNGAIKALLGQMGKSFTDPDLQEALQAELLSERSSTRALANSPGGLSSTAAAKAAARTELLARTAMLKRRYDTAREIEQAQAKQRARDELGQQRQQIENADVMLVPTDYALGDLAGTAGGEIPAMSLDEVLRRMEAQ